MRSNFSKKFFFLSAIPVALIFLTSCGLSLKKEKDESHPEPSNVAPKFSAVVTFGDSLSDTGNIKFLTSKLSGSDFPILERAIPISPDGDDAGYYAGRFSNDKIWIDRFLEALNIEAQDADTCLTGGSNSSCNYAFGGSTTDESISSDEDLIKNLFKRPEIEKFIGSIELTIPQHLGIKQMVEAYLANSKPSQEVVNHTLYVIWGGGNDYMARATPPDVVSHLISSIKNILDYSTNDEKVYFMIPNLPDIGQSPYASEQKNHDLNLTELTKKHNLLLKEKLASEITENPKYKNKAVIIEVDIAEKFTEIVNNPKKFNFTNTTDACFKGGYFPDNHSKDCGDSNHYVFWDDIHPTSHAHCEITKTALEAMASSNLLDNPQVAENFKCE